MQYSDLDDAEQAQNYSRGCSYKLLYIRDTEEGTQYKFGSQRAFFKVSETLCHDTHEMKMLRRCSKPKSKMLLHCLFRTLSYCVSTVNFVTAVIQVVQLVITTINPLNSELIPICYLLALLGAHHFLHVSRIRVKLLTLR